MKSKTKFKLLYLVSALLILYTLVGFFLIPWIIKSQMLKRLPVALNREVTLEKVRFNPFTLTGQLQQFQIIDPDGQTFVSLGNFKGNFQLSSIFHKGFRFKEISFQEPYLRIQRNADATMNFTDLIQNSSDEVPPDGQEARELPIVHVKQFRMTAGVVVVQDQSPKSHFNKEIRDIGFSIDDFSTERDKTGQVEFKAASETAEAFGWTGELSLNPLVLKGHLVVTAFELPNSMPYVEHLLSGQIESGIVSLGLHYEVLLQERGLDLIINDGSFSLNDFSLRTHDANEALVAWDSFRIKGISADLLSKEIEVDSIILEETSLFAHRHEDGELNAIKAYIGPDKDPAAATMDSPTDGNGKPWNFLVNNIHVSNTSLHLTDEGISSTADLNFNLPLIQVLALSNREDQQFETTVQLNDTLKGTATISGSGTLVPSRGDLQIEVAEWDLSVLNPFIHEFTNVDLMSGFLAVDGALSFLLKDGMPEDLLFKGGVNLSEFVSQESTGKAPLTSWSDLSVQGIHYDYSANQLDVRSIDYLNPKVGVIIREDGSINVARLIKPRDIQEFSMQTPVEIQAEEPAAASGRMNITVDSFAINNGYFSFEDFQQSPHVKLTCEEISGSALGLSSELSARPTFSLNTQVMGITPLNIEGEVNLLASQPYLDLTILLKGLEMTPFAPYFTRYVGYYLEKGLLNLDLGYKVEEQQLQAENQIVVNQLSLGDPTDSPDATGLPVPLAVSLLKDASGNIEIDVPIRGDLTDPEFKLGGVILKTISNLILKLASSPFNLLAKLANVSAEELQTVSFKPGDAELREASTVNLDALSQAMEERPGIRLEISVAIDPELETPALVKGRLMAELESSFEVSQELNLSPEEQYQMRVEKAYRKDQLLLDKLQELPSFQEMESALQANIQISQNDLNQLALQRKQSIRNYLVSTKAIAPDRVLIVEDQSLEVNDSGLSVAHLEIK